MKHEKLRLFMELVFYKKGISTEKALNEFMELNEKNDLIDLANDIEKFLIGSNNGLNKESFIKENVAIDFSELNKTPIEWLEEIKVKLAKN